ncbi:MAG: right-handed parallel beta-helix repeat-containing protein [Thermoguttaceae bacterium]|nr:right-handed parallel beta-helix repeat-containing protein [Thermoguttaceae bacterium]
MSIQKRTITPQDDLAAAVAATPQKGTLILAKGVYSLKECLVVDKTMTLKSESGNPNDVRIVRAGSTVLLITDGKPTFEALTILATQGSGNDPNVDVPIKYEGAVAVREKGAPTFVNCQASSKEKAAFSVLGKKTSIRISGCRIKDTGEAGVYFHDHSSGHIERSVIETPDCAPYLYENPDTPGCGCVQIEEGSAVEIRSSTLVSGPNRAIILYNNASVKLGDCILSAPGHQCVWMECNSRLLAVNSEFTSCNRKKTKSGVEIVATDGVYLHDSYAEFQNCRFSALRIAIAPVTNSNVKGRNLVFQDVLAPAISRNETSKIDIKNPTVNKEKNYDFDLGANSDEQDEQESVKEFSEEENAKAYLIKEAYFIELLNKPSSVNLITLDGALGGGDVPFIEGGHFMGFYHPNSKFGGTFVVSKELAEPDFEWPGNDLFQSYELAIATREPLPYENPTKGGAGVVMLDERSGMRNAFVKYGRLKSILSYFGHGVQRGVTLNRFMTVGIPDSHPDSDIAGSYFIIDVLDLRQGKSLRSSFATFDQLSDDYKRQIERKYPGIFQSILNGELPGKPNDSRPYFGLMVLIEITYSELEQIMTHDYREGFINDLKAANQWPFSDLDKRKPLF